MTSIREVNEPIISKLLFLQYLSGKKPSEPLRKTCTDGFTDSMYHIITLENMDNKCIGLS